MHYRLRELFARIYPEEEIKRSGLIGDEAFVVTDERLLLYSREGWIDEFLHVEIDCELVETESDKCIQIIDLTDPTAQCYVYYGLYENWKEVISALLEVGISVYPSFPLPDSEVQGSTAPTHGTPQDA